MVLRISALQLKPTALMENFYLTLKEFLFMNLWDFIQLSFLILRKS